ncbi:MAG TPA: hypothetical protein VFA11_17625 [Acidimicrobiales bacterium]|nr:hypothetical protein [Acidimicrobiales bacterium]
MMVRFATSPSDEGWSEFDMETVRRSHRFLVPERDATRLGTRLEKVAAVHRGDLDVAVYTPPAPVAVLDSPEVAEDVLEGFDLPETVEAPFGDLDHDQQTGAEPVDDESAEGAELEDEAAPAKAARRGFFARLLGRAPAADPVFGDQVEMLDSDHAEAASAEAFFDALTDVPAAVADVPQALPETAPSIPSSLESYPPGDSIFEDSADAPVVEKPARRRRRSKAEPVVDESADQPVTGGPESVAYPESALRVIENDGPVTEDGLVYEIPSKRGPTASMVALLVVLAMVIVAGGLYLAQRQGLVHVYPNSLVKAAQPAPAPAKKVSAPVTHTATPATTPAVVAPVLTVSAVESTAASLGFSCAVGEPSQVNCSRSAEDAFIAINTEGAAAKLVALAFQGRPTISSSINLFTTLAGIQYSGASPSQASQWVRQHLTGGSTDFGPVHFAVLAGPQSTVLQITPTS